MKQSEQQAVTKLFDKDSTIRESQVKYMHAPSNVWVWYYILYHWKPGAKLHAYYIL